MYEEIKFDDQDSVEERNGLDRDSRDSATQTYERAQEQRTRAQDLIDRNDVRLAGITDLTQRAQRAWQVAGEDLAAFEAREAAEAKRQRDASVVAAELARLARLSGGPRPLPANGMKPPLNYRR